MIYQFQRLTPEFFFMTPDLTEAWYILKPQAALVVQAQGFVNCYMNHMLLSLAEEMLYFQVIAA